MFNLQLLKFEAEFGTSERRNLWTSDHWKYERRNFDRWNYERRSLWSLIAGTSWRHDDWTSTRMNVFKPTALHLWILYLWTLHLKHCISIILNLSNPWKLQNSNLWICLCLVNAIQTHTLIHTWVTFSLRL